MGILAGGGFFLSGRFTRASNAAPSNVQITAVTPTSVRLTWTTDGASQGVVEYGTSPTSLTLFAPEGQATRDHAVDLTLLTPDTTYYFQIKMGDQTHTNTGAPWSFSTLPGEGGAPAVTGTQVAPTASPTAAAPQSGTCTDTDCEAMKAKMGRGCTTQDYFQCVRKLTPTP